MAQKSAKLLNPPTRNMTYEPADDRIYWQIGISGMFKGTVDDVNALLTQLGYKKIAVRANLMSGKKFIEAEDTPVYLSPASETYWSM